MRPPTSITTDLVLLGAGHAHVEVLRRFARRAERGVRLTLIAREPHMPYSGMLPGLIRGDYSFDEAHIDLAPLASAAGARLIVAEATAIDLTRRAVAVAGRTEIGFDLLSVDVGGVPAMPDEVGIPVKPIGRFLDHLAALQATLPAGARIAVIGGGPAGTELALALAYRLGKRVRLVLVTAASEPLDPAPSRARAVARAALVNAGVEIVCGVTAGALTNGRLALSDGSFLDAAAALWATNVVGPAFLGRSGLACDDAGCIRVTPGLRSLSHPAVFAAGDCAAMEAEPRPKSGVWAVRAGTILAKNLRRVVHARSPRAWHPQRDALVIMGLGEKRALAWRNGIVLWGGPIWRWKDWIDRAWMRRYALRATPAPDAQLRCGGVGADLAAVAQAEVLAGLAVSAARTVPSRPEMRDDGVALRPPSGMLVVQSVDHVRAPLDDPFVVGEIAAAHALSALHAMGANPWTALAIAAVPSMPAEKMRADLAAMMQGTHHVLAADDCTLIGANFAAARETSLGFAVTGLLDPRLAWRKSGLHDGDALVLTKPLGTGVLLAGHMRGLTKARWLLAALDSMRHSDSSAARVLRAHGVTACSRVGGFGLAGHLAEMLRASGVTATIRPDALPLLPGAPELAEYGVRSTLAASNLRALSAALGEAEAATKHRRRGRRGAIIDLLADPQISGGLLAGVPSHRAERCVATLAAAGLQAAIIGVVESSAGDPPSIRLD